MRPEEMDLDFEDAAAEAPVERDRFPLIAWWRGLDPRDQALYQGLLPLALGFAADPWHRAWALGLIVPGMVMTLVAVAYLVLPVIRRAA